jgi:hypothetical protein
MLHQFGVTQARVQLDPAAAVRFEDKRRLFCPGRGKASDCLGDISWAPTGDPPRTQKRDQFHPVPPVIIAFNVRIKIQSQFTRVKLASCLSRREEDAPSIKGGPARAWECRLCPLSIAPRGSAYFGHQVSFALNCRRSQRILVILKAAVVPAETATSYNVLSDP